MAAASRARASPPRRARAGAVARAIAVFVVISRRRTGTFLKFIELAPDPHRVDGLLARHYRFAVRPWRTIDGAPTSVVGARTRGGRHGHAGSQLVCLRVEETK